jgi:hypothetical protein
VVEGERIEVIQSPLFQQQKKKLHRNQVKDLDSKIRDIIKNRIPVRGKTEP